MGMIRCACVFVLFNILFHMSLYTCNKIHVIKAKAKQNQSRTLSMLADWMSCPLSLILRRKLIMACWYSGLPWANGVGLKVAGSRRPESNPSTIWGKKHEKRLFFTINIAGKCLGLYFLMEMLAFKNACIIQCAAFLPAKVAKVGHISRFPPNFF